MLYNRTISLLMQRYPQVTRKLVYYGIRSATRCLAWKHLMTGQVRRIDCRWRTVMGLRFANSLGVAAGFDRHGDSGRSFGHLGFGHVEIGTLTRRPEVGHNLGIDVLKDRELKHNTAATILGINIGLNRHQRSENITPDLAYCMAQSWRHADYIAINLSNPSAAVLINGAQTVLLETVLSELKVQQQRLTELSGRYVPVAIKISLSTADAELPPIIKQVKRQGFDGLIVAIDSEKGVGQDKQAQWQQTEQQDRACHLIQQLSCELDNMLPLIAVGGIQSAIHIQQRIAAGADLVQMHNGLIYQGPEIIGYLSPSWN